MLLIPAFFDLDIVLTNDEELDLADTWDQDLIREACNAYGVFITQHHIDSLIDAMGQRYISYAHVDEVIELVNAWIVRWIEAGAPLCPQPPQLPAQPVLA